MDQGTAQQLLERLGCRQIRIRGDQIMATCPFGMNHYRGDRKPSFSAAIKEGKSPYWCFACQEKGTLEWLASSTGNEDLVPDWKPTKVPRRKWMSPPVHRFREEKEAAYFSDFFIKPFTGVLSGYLKRRGITIETAREWELGLDREHKRAIFVARDITGRIVLVKGRDITGRAKVKYATYVQDMTNCILTPWIDYDREFDFKRPSKSLFLYGEYQAKKFLDGEVERKSRDLIVVEGEMDVLKMWQHGWNVVGLFGSYASEEQCKKILQLLPEDGRLIALMDNDKAGRESVLVLGEALADKVMFLDALLPDGMDPGEASLEQLLKSIDNAGFFNLTRARRESNDRKKRKKRTGKCRA